MEKLLESAVPKKTGESDAVMVANLIGLMIAIIISVAVLLPVTQSVISGIEHPTGGTVDPTLKSILDVVPVIIAVIPIVLVATILM